MFFESLIIASLGGFAGSGCRYLTGIAAKKMFGPSFPFGTFAVNVIGCFLIGLFFGFWTRQEMSPLINALLITGFCGGYTTFSSFSHDSYKMIQERQWGKLCIYVIPSVVLGLLMVWLGMKCA